MAGASAPPEGAPNVVFIVLDDAGFAHLGCYGSEIETPNMDRLAANGLRYINFHTTALCSPTRACLLTGRNHHSVGVGRITEMAAGYPGYFGADRRRAATLAEILKPTATTRWPSASGTCCQHRHVRGRPLRRLASRAGASSTTTASSAARRTSGTPTSSPATNGHCRRIARTITSAKTSSTKR